MATTTTLHIYLLGSFRLLDNTSPVEGMNSPRLQSLLAYLVLHRDAPQERAHLAYLLWPDSAESQALTNLRNLVHLLRRGIPEPDSFLRLDSRSLQWKPDSPFTLDVADFDRYIEEGNRAAQEGNSEAALSALQSAASLYRGDLLPDRYDEWVLVERERLRECYIAAMERLAALFEAQGDYSTAISYAQRLLRYDPLQESTYRLLMRLYIGSGDRPGALRTYRNCAAVLQRELGVEPGAATKEVLYDQVYERLEAEKPAQPFHTRPNNLPALTTLFIGRERELAAASALLRRQSVRLVTFSGTAGVGKTRLALRVADDLLNDFADGVFFVSLASLARPEFVAQAVGEAPGAPWALRETAGRDASDVIVDYLREKQLLLVLDNFEHLLPAAQLVSVLLEKCPALKVLVTSRAVLHLRGEHEFPVPPLDMPDARRTPAHALTVEELSQYEAIALFLDRATEVKPQFALTSSNAHAVAAICERLDGLPLAIELAAARVRALSPQMILDRLSSRLMLLVDGARDLPPRQQALRSAIAWSYDVLDPPEQALFRSLGVFAGGFTLDSVEALFRMRSGEFGMRNGEFGMRNVPDPVFIPHSEFPIPSSADVLTGITSLLDRSLIIVRETPQGQLRYYMLETLREYALDRLDKHAETAEVRSSVAHYWADLAEHAAAALNGPQPESWLERLAEEYDNLRAALEWLTSTGEEETALRLATALRWFWELRSYNSEGLNWLNAAIALGQGPGDPALLKLRADALNAAGALAFTQPGRYEEAYHYLQASLALRRDLGLTADVASSLNNLGALAKEEDDRGRARTYFEESIAQARQANDRRVLAIALTNLGEVETRTANYVQAESLLEEALTLCRELGIPKMISNALNNLGRLAMYEGDYERATHLCVQGLALRQKLGDAAFVCDSHNELGDIAINRGDAAGAAEHYRTALGVILQLERGLNDDSQSRKQGRASRGWPGLLMFKLAIAAQMRYPQRYERPALLIGAAEVALAAFEYEFRQVLQWQMHLRPLAQDLSTYIREDDAAWQALRARGRAMSVERAIAYALGEAQSEDPGPGASVPS